MDYCCTTKLPSSPYLHLGRRSERPYFQNVTPRKFFVQFSADTRIYASKSSPKRLKKPKELQKIVNPQLAESSVDEQNEISDKSSPTDSVNNFESRASVAIASRSSVIQACTLTSGFIAFMGVIIRQMKS